MKNLIIISILSVLTITVSTATAKSYPDEYLGLPGDNLNLYATMKLFQESETLEGFERSLNDQNSNINNLDLNGDKLVDYITVMDYVDGSVHTIVLRTALNRNETQDIAVFTVQQFDDGSARIQLIGDEALYGKNYIVEPIYADSQETPNPGYIGNSRVVETPRVVAVTTYEVATWPIIRFIYRPGYTCWHSSWTWGYYPSYWNPWRPYYWHTYYGYHSHFHNHYYSHYRHWNHHRYHRYHDFYYGHVRTYSPRVSVKIKKGSYRSTYSRPDLRKRGNDLYARSSRRESSVVKSGNRRTTSNPQSVRSRSVNTANSSSARRSVTTNPTRTRTSSSTNRGSEYTRKSTTVQSRRSTNPVPGNKKAVSPRSENRSNSSYRTNGNSSRNRNKEIQQKSVTYRDSRTTKSTSYRQSNRQPRQSSSTYSKKSSSQPKMSSSSRSSYRQPKVSSRSSSSNGRNSKATRNNQSRSSSRERSNRR